VDNARALVLKDISQVRTRQAATDR